ncbi:RimK family alpha-L-glutamate ligase [Virgibacillus phasianinus]|uniref:RimK family alpha-L-glutamate ligase n=1 Tax=Virgibacillus phasianinus TaxID=2017483 RepID=A0A220U5E4_9BACI|nr:RimK family alpha-L-glutamate ligase [Virgibacillus phasianinus]ASK63061.1 RimK family alpha-L-glutamate ligase [Virgibacillus phasianinus]
MRLNGWIIYNGHLPGNKFLDFAEWLQKAAARKDVPAKIWKNNELLSFLTADEVILIDDDEQLLPNFVIFTDKDIYLANQLEQMGVRVYNCSDAIRISDDKILTYQALSIHNLPIPKTIIAPKIFMNNVEVDHATCDKAVTTLGLPMIVKEAFGSFGEQVYLVHTAQELKEKVAMLQGKPFMFQEFIDSSYGKDMRLHVVGDEVVAAMMRTASDDFRANVTAGGTMESYQPTPKENEIAIAATKAIGADFAGVDLLFGADGHPIICELNSNAHIRNMYDCTKINVADYIIDYIVDKEK